MAVNQRFLSFFRQIFDRVGIDLAPDRFSVLLCRTNKVLVRLNVRLIQEKLLRITTHLLEVCLKSSAFSHIGIRAKLHVLNQILANLPFCLLSRKLSKVDKRTEVVLRHARLNQRVEHTCVVPAVTRILHRLLRHKKLIIE